LAHRDISRRRSIRSLSARSGHQPALPGLKFERTLWVANVAGGPFKFTATKPGKTPLGLEEAHRDLKITSEEFDAVAEELAKSLDFAKVPKREKDEVLAAFAAHKNEVIAGSKRG
jgi:hemoglobin